MVTATLENLYGAYSGHKGSDKDDSVIDVLVTFFWRAKECKTVLQSFWWFNGAKTSKEQTGWNYQKG